MTAAATIYPIAETSPRAKARLTGAFYLITIVLGIIGQGFVSDRLIAFSNAPATAANILAHESLYRAGFTIFLVELGCQIAMTALFYELLKPAGRTASMFAAVFGVTGCVIKILSRLFFFAPLLVLKDAAYLSGFDAAQSHALALLLLKINDHGAAIAMIFFGVAALFKGYLIVRSTFLPRALGVLTMVAGIGWLAYLWPPLGYRIFPVIGALGLLGSLANILWLLIVGVNEERWLEQARAASTSIWR